jgi:hypothetical protein
MRPIIMVALRLARAELLEIHDNGCGCHTQNVAYIARYLPGCEVGPKPGQHWADCRHEKRGAALQAIDAALSGDVTGG